MGFFGGRGRGKGRNGRPNRGAQPYNAVPQGVSHGYHNSGGGKKSRTCNPKVACFAVLVWMAVVVMSSITLVGCMSKSPGIDQLYLVELRHNTSYEFRFGIGYFGGCISATSLDESASTSSSTHCVDNLRAPDLDDLTETFVENLPSASDLGPVLNTALPLARDLQTNVFFFPLPPIHLSFFGLSGAILLFGLGGKARSRAYNFGIVAAAVLGALAMTTAFIMCIGSLQAMNALELLIGGDNTDASTDANLIADPVRIDIGNGIRLHGAHSLAHVQYALAAFTMLFYVLLGTMYAKRKPDEPIVVMSANPMRWARR